MNLSSILTHQAQLRRVASANNGWGDAERTSAVTTACFLHGAHERRRSKTGQALDADFQMWVTPPTSVVVGDAVENVVNRDGTTLLASGRVVDVRAHEHPTQGSIATRALIVRV